MKFVSFLPHNIYKDPVKFKQYIDAFVNQLKYEMGLGCEEFFKEIDISTLSNSGALQNLLKDFIESVVQARVKKEKEGAVEGDEGEVEGGDEEGNTEKECYMNYFFDRMGCNSHTNIVGTCMILAWFICINFPSMKWPLSGLLQKVIYTIHPSQWCIQILHKILPGASGYTTQYNGLQKRANLWKDQWTPCETLLYLKAIVVLVYVRRHRY